MKLSIKQKDFLNKIPKSPGVYRFFAEDNELLYVGKAINLYKRVKSYFQKQYNTSPRIALMVAKISYLEITITENETSALILENNLIKELKPKYNIIFRDDKTYPLIRITGHQFPKIDYYRGKTLKSNVYFGPYPNATATKQTIDTIQRIFKLRTCSDSFFNNRTRPCILYQIKRCTAPCVGYVDIKQYKDQIDSAKDFLNGKYNELLELLSKKMYDASELMDFETAATIRDEITMIKQIQVNQIITSHNKALSADLIIHDIVSNKLHIYLIVIRNGMYIGDNNFVVDVIDEDYINSLEVFLENYYLNNRNTKLIILETVLDKEFIQFFASALQIKIDNKISDKVEGLFAMGKINLRNIIESNDSHIIDAINVLSHELDSIVNRIECIDVSHNQGENAVASIVVFDNGIIDNSQYRKFNLPIEVNGNDLLAMEMVLNRRLTKVDSKLPDVILVDGGKLQFETVKNIISKHSLCGKIKVVAIFKGEKRNPKLDRLILEDTRIISYKDASNLFRLLQKLRDEAHRFAITGHRKKQVKKMSNSVIVEIPNVGMKTRKALLLHFGSVKAIAEASVNDLQEVVGIGNVLANQIYSYFH
ncbi:MAG: excinuclease ABC subunit UvrC [Neisseriaceae bacterium]